MCLATEDADSVGAKTYGNIVAVKKGNEKSAAIKALDQKVLKSDTVEKIYQRQIWWSCCTSVLRTGEDENYKVIYGRSKKLLKKSTEVMKLLSVRKLRDNSLSDSWELV